MTSIGAPGRRGLLCDSCRGAITSQRIMRARLGVKRRSRRQRESGLESLVGLQWRHHCELMVGCRFLTRASR